MSAKRPQRRLRGLVLVLAGLAVLALPVASSSQVPPGGPTASVTVCQVTGSATAPQFAEVQVSVDEVTAFLNQFPGSYVGSCPEGGGGAPAPSGAVRVCHVGGSATAPILTEVLIAADQLTVFLNQNPGSFAGSCPAASGGAGNAGQGGAGPVSAVVTVCRVTGSASAPEVAQLTLTVDRVAAFLNRNPGSFVGTCPGEGGTVTQGPGRILGIPAGSALAICRVTASAGVLHYQQVNVGIEQVAAYLNQHSGSFVGLCPGAGDPNGTVGAEPVGFVTICRVTATGEGLVAVTIRRDDLSAYLARPGTVVPAPTAGCPQVSSEPRQDPPDTMPPGESRTIVVQTTPNTVVTATGAGVNERTRSDEKGEAKLTVKPKRTGVVTVRAAGGKAVKRVGVAGVTKSAANLTG